MLGVYFDITVTNTTTLFVSLANSAHLNSGLLSKGGQRRVSASSTFSSPPASTPDPGRPSFHTSALLDTSAPPISLLARVDQEEYVLLPNSSGLVSIRSDDLAQRLEHQVRIIAPMTDSSGKGMIQLEGLWLSKGGKLLEVEGSGIHQDVGSGGWPYMDATRVGRKPLASPSGGHQAWKAAQINPHDGQVEEWVITSSRKKILEVITDSPGGLGSQHLLSGVMGWEYLLGDMFDADHVGIGADGICITQNCIGGTGEPSGMGDAFFRR